jgi:carbamoyltransferase
MIILGVCGAEAIFHDSSATLVIDGTIVASVEEERFNRKKHSDGLPFNAIAYCLQKGGVSPSDIDDVGFFLEPDALLKRMHGDIAQQYGHVPRTIAYLVEATANSFRMEEKLRERFTFGARTRFHYLNHHLTHASSAYHISGFERAAVLTIDGFGERESATLYSGSPTRLERVHEFLAFPESLGLLYNAVAAHLGLGWVSGPGKLMGLAGYGTPDPRLFQDVILLLDDARRPVEIDASFLDFFRLALIWSTFRKHAADGKARTFGRTSSFVRGASGLSDKAMERLGEPRLAGDALTQRHCDVAASMQDALERAVLQIVRQVPKWLPDETNLCFAGGVALNVSTNRRIVDSDMFERLFVPPPANDGGTSLGCALYLTSLRSRRWRYDFDVYSGPHIEDDFDVEAACSLFGDRITYQALDEDELVRRAADCLVANKLVGWVQGRMECGPRALGGRSILANPMDPGVKDALNARVKKREAFRPYAPSVLREESSNWFDLDESPFMLLEATVHPHQRDRVPGIVHVDGTSRPQTVTESANPRYYRLIRAFYERSGVPLILNTSFNRHGEPIVNRPEEAITVLLETELDELFLGRYHIRRRCAN